MRDDHVRGEGGVSVLKDNGHDVVADVTLPLQLLRVRLDERQEGGDVEHDLVAVEGLVQRKLARLPVLRVQAAPVTLNPEVVKLFWRQFCLSWREFNLTLV